MAKNLIVKGKIMTTLPRAKELRPYVEKLVTTSKTDTLANRRLTIARLAIGTHTEVLTKLYGELGVKYKERAGGYTRITKMNPRKGDGSPMAVIEFV